MLGGASGPHWRGGFVITLGGVPCPGGVWVTAIPGAIVAPATAAAALISARRDSRLVFRGPASLDVMGIIPSLAFATDAGDPHAAFTDYPRCDGANPVK